MNPTRHMLGSAVAPFEPIILHTIYRGGSKRFRETMKFGWGKAMSVCGLMKKPLCYHTNKSVSIWFFQFVKNTWTQNVNSVSTEWKRLGFARPRIVCFCNRYNDSRRQRRRRPQQQQQQQQPQQPQRQRQRQRPKKNGGVCAQFDCQKRTKPVVFGGLNAWTLAKEARYILPVTTASTY